MTTLSRAPIYVQLGGRKRELVFNLNTAILLRDVGCSEKPLAVKREDGSGYEVNLDVLRAYLWAGLQKDARLHSYEMLSQDEVGELITRDQIMPLITLVQSALLRFYGQEPKAEGEAKAAGADRSSRRRGQSRNGSALSAGK